MEPTWDNITLLATKLRWDCFGCAVLTDTSGENRKVVGVSKMSPKRRDFVRLVGQENNTALSAQVGIYAT